MKKTKGNISNTMYCSCETQTSVAKTQASDRQESKFFIHMNRFQTIRNPQKLFFSYFRQKLHLIQSSWLGVIKHEYSKCSGLGFTQP